jgi:Uma2 family endonuclease
MSLPRTLPRLSEAEYLKIERAAEFKSEFFDGEMFAMAGGSVQHSTIGLNLAAEFRAQLKGQCVPHHADLRIKIEATGLLTYPDLAVICGAQMLAERTSDTVVNPIVIGEVLSDSTEAYDRGNKFEHYRQIPTLREYLLVSQKEARIEQFVRQENGRWLLGETKGLDSTLEIPSLGIVVPLSGVYLAVQFVPSPIRLPTPPRAI